MLKKIMRKQGGFTLLELLIVIVIIGILALLIIPNITSAPKKARDTQRKTDLRALQKGLEEYFVSNNAYPVGTGVADTVLGSTNGTGVLDNSAGGATPIMKTVPKDPKSPSAAPYQYLYTATASTAYTLTACLENNADSTTSVVAPVSPCTTKTLSLTNQN